MVLPMDGMAAQPLDCSTIVVEFPAESNQARHRIEKTQKNIQERVAPVNPSGFILFRVAGSVASLALAQKARR